METEHENVRLSQFLQALDFNIMVEIIDSSDGEIYLGRAGDLTQRILNLRNITGTCIVEGHIRIYTERINDAIF